MNFKFFYLLLCFVVLSSASDFQPKITQTKVADLSGVYAFEGTKVLLRVTEEKLFCSRDNGDTWLGISSINDNMNVTNLQLDPFFSERAFVGGSKHTYVTEDQGETWEKMGIASEESKNVSFLHFEFKTHPTRREYLIARGLFCYTEDNDALNNESSSWFGMCGAKSFISSDGGKQFTEMFPASHNPLKGLFSDANCQFTRLTKDSQLGDESTVFCKFYMSTGETGDEGHLSVELFTTKDFGKTVEKVDQFNGESVRQFQILNEYVIVSTQEVSHSKNSVKRIWISKDGSKFQEALFPKGPYSSHLDFSLDSDGKIFRFVSNFLGHKSKSGNSEVFMSDSTGLKFSKVSALSSDLEGGYSGTKIDHLAGVVVSSFITTIFSDESAKISTVISFDNGFTWSKLRIVDPEHKGGYACDIDDLESCSLQIYGNEGSLFSSMRSPGATSSVLMTTGTVSSGHEFEHRNLQTYISRDGAATWSKAFDFPANFAIGDNGNVIVAVPSNLTPDNEPVGEIYYSLNQGYTWLKQTLKDKLYPFDLFVTNKDGSGSTFVLSGTSSLFAAQDQVAYIYTIDFSEVFGGKTCSESDFEYQHESNGKCVNGLRYKLKKRRQDAQCLVKKANADIEKVVGHCYCTDRDYECSPEFILNENGKCTLSPNLLHLSGACNSSSSTIKMQPMRLSSGNKCRNPLSVDAVDVSCKELTSKANKSGKSEDGSPKSIWTFLSRSFFSIIQ